MVRKRKKMSECVDGSVDNFRQKAWLEERLK